MAALIEPLPPSAYSLRNLREFTAGQLEPLLEEELCEWREVLDWDYSRSIDLVRRFLDLRALYGSALVDDHRVTGYCYYVFEEHKGIVGDLYLNPRHRSRDRELVLMQAVMQEMMAAPFVTRIESQLMLSPPHPLRNLPFSQNARSYERGVMLANLDLARDFPLHNVPGQIRIDGWADYYQEAAAVLIEEAYQGHIDALINDQYRSVTGARRFIYNIVNYPGCGSFSPEASLVAVNSVGELAALVLASIVNDRTGHITQICVAPAFRSTGLGYEMMRRSMVRLLHNGCRRVSLTVTSSNEGATRLYTRMGFRTIHQFQAYVWEGWQ